MASAGLVLSSTPQVRVQVEAVIRCNRAVKSGLWDTESPHLQTPSDKERCHFLLLCASTCDRCAQSLSWQWRPVKGERPEVKSSQSQDFSPVLTSHTDRLDYSCAHLSQHSENDVAALTNHPEASIQNKKLVKRWVGHAAAHFLTINYDKKKFKWGFQSLPTERNLWFSPNTWSAHCAEEEVNQRCDGYKQRHD